MGVEERRETGAPAIHINERRRRFQGEGWQGKPLLSFLETVSTCFRVFAPNVGRREQNILAFASLVRRRGKAKKTKTKYEKKKPLKYR